MKMSWRLSLDDALLLSSRLLLLIRGNKSFLAEAYSLHGYLLSIASNLLETDSEVVSAAVFKLSHRGFFQNNPEAAEIAVNAYNGDKYKTVYKHFPDSIFFQRNVLLTWLVKNWKGDIITANLMLHGGLSNDRAKFSFLW